MQNVSSKIEKVTRRITAKIKLNILTDYEESYVFECYLKQFKNIYLKSRMCLNAI